MIEKKKKVEENLAQPPEIKKEPKAKKGTPEAVYNFPLKQRSVRAKNLQEAIKKVNAKE